MGFSSIQSTGQDRYVLGKMIAKGGMAEIYIAKAVGAEDFYKICAVKRILPQYAQEEEFLQMFRTEADICKRLQHTNIVQVMDFATISGSYGIVMEYVDGVDLRTILAACEQAGVKLTVPMVIYITAMIARGLHYTHVKKDDLTGRSLDLIHRDVSPQNILIGFEGDVKLTDFGIAHFESKTIETQPGVVKGKYAYMSPEQVKGQKLDYQTDVYSLAIVMWEALAMKRLFCGETEIDTIKNVQECKIRYNLKELNSSVDEELYEIVMKELSVDKNKRFSSAATFEKALLKYLYTYYPDFTVIELSNFLKKLLAAKRRENQELIKSLALTQLGNFTESKTTTKTNPADSNVLVEAKDKESQDEQGFVANKGVILKSSTPLNVNIGQGGNLIGGINPSVRGVGNSVGGGLSIGSRIPASGYGTHAGSISYHSKYSGTGVRRGGGTLNRRGGLLPYNSSRSGTNYSILLPFTILLLLFGYGVFVLNQKTHFLSMSSTYRVQVSSLPDLVKIKVGNNYLNKGNPIKTPATLKLKEDPSMITIERDGFISRSIPVTSESNSINVILSKKKKDTGIVDINIRQKKKVYIEYDRILKRFTPVSLLNVDLNSSHSIQVYPGYPNKTGGFKCNFTLKGQRSTLLIDVDGKRCELLE